MANYTVTTPPIPAYRAPTEAQVSPVVATKVGMGRYVVMRETVVLPASGSRSVTRTLPRGILRWLNVTTIGAAGGNGNAAVQSVLFDSAPNVVLAMTGATTNTDVNTLNPCLVVNFEAPVEDGFMVDASLLNLDAINAITVLVTIVVDVDANAQLGTRGVVRL